MEKRIRRRPIKTQPKTRHITINFGEDDYRAVLAMAQRLRIPMAPWIASLTMQAVGRR